MTIRYQCDSCGSKLNIKEELAGTAGKCPKCKTEFTVPHPEPAAADGKAEQKTVPTSAHAKAASSAKGTPATKDKPARAKMAAKAVAKSAPDDEDFDPVAFLMEDEAAAAPSAAASPPLSDDEIPADLELEVADEESSRSRQKSRARRRVMLDSDAEMELDSASAKAGAMLSSGSSSGAARDLLTRTVEESRARASRVDDDQAGEPSETMEIAKELAIRGLPGLLAIALLAVGMWWISNWMMGSGLDLPDLGRVSGTITLDSQPLAGARITFIPVEQEFEISPNKKVRVRPARGTTDENGYYKLDYADNITGAAVGEHRVTISKLDGPRELAPANFGPYSMETRTVESGSNEFDFELKSDAAHQR